VCVYTYREYLQLCPLAYLAVCGLVCCQYLRSWSWQLLLVILYCTWNSYGLRKHMTCTVLSKQFICNTSEKYLLWKKEL
jgi:hypothetical protein